MTSLKGNRDAQRKREQKERAARKKDRGRPRLEPNERVTKINVRDLEKYIDDN